jgi:hypothetical protein
MGARLEVTSSSMVSWSGVSRHSCSSGTGRAAFRTAATSRPVTSRSEASMAPSAASTSRARSRRRVSRCMRSAMASFARPFSMSSCSFCSSAACFSRSTSTWRSTSETAALPRWCGSFRRASTPG